LRLCPRGLYGTVPQSVRHAACARRSLHRGRANGQSMHTTPPRRQASSPTHCEHGGPTHHQRISNPQQHAPSSPWRSHGLRICRFTLACHTSSTSIRCTLTLGRTGQTHGPPLATSPHKLMTSPPSSRPSARPSARPIARHVPSLRSTRHPESWTRRQRRRSFRLRGRRSACPPQSPSRGQAHTSPRHCRLASPSGDRRRATPKQ